jgi:hypothetical protein
MDTEEASTDVLHTEFYLTRAASKKSLELASVRALKYDCMSVVLTVHSFSKMRLSFISLDRT